MIFFHLTGSILIEYKLLIFDFTFNTNNLFGYFWYAFILAFFCFYSTYFILKIKSFKVVSG